MSEWTPDAPDPSYVEDPNLNTNYGDSMGDAPPADVQSQDPDVAGDSANIPGEDITSFGMTPRTSDFVSRLTSWSVGGPRGIVYQTPGGGSMIPVGPGGPGSRGRRDIFGAQGHDRLKAILVAIWNRVGKKIALHAIVALCERWGLPVAASAFGVGADDLTFLIAENAVVRRGRGRRGPHLHTILKRIRRGDRYRHLLQRWSAKAGIHRHRAPAYAFHRRTRRHRRK